VAVVLQNDVGRSWITDPLCRSVTYNILRHVELLSITSSKSLVPAEVTVMVRIDGRIHNFVGFESIGKSFAIFMLSVRGSVKIWFVDSV